MKYILIALLLSGCTMEMGEQTKESKVKTTECTDTRDGEKFVFKNSTLKNARRGYGGADTCLTVTDSAGKDRELCKSMEVYLKCHNI